MKKISLIALFSILLLNSCYQDEILENSKKLTFEQIEGLFEMKNSFSKVSKKAILSKYATLENYYDFSIKRKEIIRNSSKVNKDYHNKVLANYTITLFNRDNDLLVNIYCKDDERILDRAEEQGIDLPYSDRAGASSTCAGRLHSGTIDQNDQTFLDDDQIDAGYVLLCVAFPLSNCVIETHVEDQI